MRARLALGSSVDRPPVRTARLFAAGLVGRAGARPHQVDLVVTPTLTIFPPRFDEAEDLLVARCTLPVNLAGVPAVSLPVPAAGGLPASIQLIGPANSEERLLAAAADLEAAVAGG